MSKVYLFIF
uniref:Uncharacterized protein n=1 Tax=Rhizophora mucronata TaxID=61149 RepID=A0A2P2R3F5_RHIMU